MTRIAPANANQLESPIRKVLDAQQEKWGAPLLNHLLYARRPTIFRGVRAMWTGIEASGRIDARLRALINRRVAAINGCEF
jgi:alkylhydroperoxidase family enzyme